MKKANRALIALEITVFAVIFAVAVLILRPQKIADADLSEFMNKALSITGEEDMKEGKPLDIRNLYGIEPDTVEHALYVPATNMDAKEILILRIGDKSQTEAVKAALQERIDDRVNVFKDYGVEQMVKINAAQIFVHWPYAGLIIDEKAPEVLQAWEKLASGE